MILDALLAILPAPSVPVETPRQFDWGRITSKFGTTLPSDYMAFIDRFGSGMINEWMTVYNPFSVNPYLNLVDQFIRKMSALRETRRHDPSECPFPLYFEPGGLFPWGGSIDGDIYCWLTNHEISTYWKTVVWLRHGGTELLPLRMTDFIIHGLQGKLPRTIFPADFAGSAIFSPA